MKFNNSPEAQNVTEAGAGAICVNHANARSQAMWVFSSLRLGYDPSDCNLMHWTPGSLWEAMHSVILSAVRG
jgi:hypothetical protein